MEYKEAFKYLITEFHQSKLPELVKREFFFDDIGKIISLVGFRRSGKTFLLYQLIGKFK